MSSFVLSLHLTHTHICVRPITTSESDANENTVNAANPGLAGMSIKFAQHILLVGEGTVTLETVSLLPRQADMFRHGQDKDAD